jgi:hypothetical protein
VGNKGTDLRIFWNLNLVSSQGVPGRCVLRLRRNVEGSLRCRMHVGRVPDQKGRARVAGRGLPQLVASLRQQSWGVLQKSNDNAWWSVDIKGAPSTSVGDGVLLT